MERLPIVGVIGSGTESHEPRSTTLGAWLATEGVHLLTGGGGGVMAAVSRAFHAVPERRGLVIGILPGDPAPPPGYPNRWVEIAIHTHLPLSGTHGTDPMSRNHLNVLSSDLLIALPGSAGTASEVTLATRYHKPLIAHLTDRNEIPNLPSDTHIEPTLEGLRQFLHTHLPR